MMKLIRQTDFGPVIRDRVAPPGVARLHLPIISDNWSCWLGLMKAGILSTMTDFPGFSLNPGSFLGLPRTFWIKGRAQCSTLSYDLSLV